MNPWLQIIFGLIALVVGADLLVRGAVWIALRMGLSKMMVGLTLVAFGTSAPELVVSLTSALRGQTDTALGTVLGSNLANIGLILGISASIKAVNVVGGRIAFESRYLLIATMLMVPPFILTGSIGPGLGALMVTMVVVFTFHLLLRERSRARSEGPREVEPVKAREWLINIAFVIVGGMGLMYGGDWLPSGASVLATRWGMPEYLVSMLIVGVGTSLPELATSALAAAKGHPEISLGNVIGSNIFNVGSVLGITALIQPLPVDAASMGPSLIAGCAFVLALVMLLGGLGRIPRWAGVGLLVSYVGFMSWEVLRTG